MKDINKLAIEYFKSKHAVIKIKKEKDRYLYKHYECEAVQDDCGDWRYKCDCLLSDDYLLLKQQIQENADNRKALVNKIYHELKLIKP